VLAPSKRQPRDNQWFIPDKKWLGPLQSSGRHWFGIGVAAWLDVETGFDEQIFFTDFGKSAMSAAQEMPTTEAHAREQIDAMLVACGWVVQNFSALNLGIGQGIALRGRSPHYPRRRHCGSSPCEGEAS
jgi:hypothetical protein